VLCLPIRALTIYRLGGRSDEGMGTKFVHQPSAVMSGIHEHHGSGDIK